MFNSVPLNVKLASSSISPLVPAITILLSVKSCTLRDDSVDCESTSNVPNICVLPLPCWTVKLPVPILNSVASKVKFPSSSISPPDPTITTLLLVKSSTFTDASVDCASTLRVEYI